MHSLPDIDDTSGLHLSLPANWHLGRRRLPLPLPSLTLLSSIHFSGLALDSAGEITRFLLFQHYLSSCLSKTGRQSATTFLLKSWLWRNVSEAVQKRGRLTAGPCL